MHEDASLDFIYVKNVESVKFFKQFFGMRCVLRAGAYPNGSFLEFKQIIKFTWIAIIPGTMSVIMSVVRCSQSNVTVRYVGQDECVIQLYSLNKAWNSMFQSIYQLHLFLWIFCLEISVNVGFPTETAVQNNSKKGRVFSWVDYYIINFDVKFRFFI